MEVPDSEQTLIRPKALQADLRRPKPAVAPDTVLRRRLRDGLRRSRRSLRLSRMSSPAATARGSSGSQHRSRAPTAQRATDENDVASPRRPPSLRGQPRPASGAADRFRARLARTATSASPLPTRAVRAGVPRLRTRRIEQKKAEGADPTHGAAAAASRAQTNITRKQQAREWDEQHGKLVDLSAFQRNILPLIENIPLSRLQRATGLSLRYVSLIRRGEKVPHPRHWQALLGAAALVGEE